MLGGFEERAQRSSLLREMDAVPKKVEYTRYASNGNAGDSPGCWVRHAELLAGAHVGRDPVSYSEAMRSADAFQWRRVNMKWMRLPRMAHGSYWISLQVDGL